MCGLTSVSPSKAQAKNQPTGGAQRGSNKTPIIKSCWTIYNSQVMEATEMPIDRQMDKEAVVHIYNGILLSQKNNEIELFVVRWMDLETVIQCEVSQKEINKYCMLTHIYGV